MAHSSKVKGLYRDILRFAQHIPQKGRQVNALRTIRKEFREHRDEADPVAIQAFVDKAENKLGYLKTVVPASRIPVRKRLKRKKSTQQITSYHITADGYIKEGAAQDKMRAKWSNWGDGNFDPDMIKQHKQLIERQYFRGPYWDEVRKGKPAEDMGPGFLESAHSGHVDMDFDNTPWEEQNTKHYYEAFKRTDFRREYDEEIKLHDSATHAQNTDVPQYVEDTDEGYTDTVMEEMERGQKVLEFFQHVDPEQSAGPMGPDAGKPPPKAPPAPLVRGN